jgi:hypothetical protein
MDVFSHHHHRRRRRRCRCRLSASANILLLMENGVWCVVCVIGVEAMANYPWPMNEPCRLRLLISLHS